MIVLYKGNLKGIKKMFESVLLAGLNPRNTSPGERFLQESRHNVVYFCNDGDC